MVAYTRTFPSAGPNTNRDAVSSHAHDVIAAASEESPSPGIFGKVMGSAARVAPSGATCKAAPRAAGEHGEELPHILPTVYRQRVEAQPKARGDG